MRATNTQGEKEACQPKLSMERQLPRLIHQALAREPAGDLQGQLQRLVAAQKQQSRWLAAIALLLAALIALSFY